MLHTPKALLPPSKFFWLQTLITLKRTKVHCMEPLRDYQNLQKTEMRSKTQYAASQRRPSRVISKKGGKLPEEITNDSKFSYFFNNLSNIRIYGIFVLFKYKQCYNF